MKRILITLGAVFTFGAFLFAATVQSQDFSAHEKLYKKHCKKCHAMDGSGKKKSGDWLPIVKSLKLEKPELLSLLTDEAKKTSYDDVLKVILEGKNKMKGYKAKVSEDEAKMLADYTFHLQGRKK